MAGLLKVLLFALMGYYVIKLIKPLFIRQPDNPHVKGNTGRDENIQKKHSGKIEDADFEELD